MRLFVYEYTCATSVLLSRPSVVDLSLRETPPLAEREVYDDGDQPRKHADPAANVETPSSSNPLHVEGWAMLHAVLEDFSTVPDVHVSTLMSTAATERFPLLDALNIEVIAVDSSKDSSESVPFAPLSPILGGEKSSECIPLAPLSP